MATPTKPNNTETPLGVIPGVPHWAYTNKHGQRNHGQGYDYHDPTGLQQADGAGGYTSGNAITMFGTVGFRPDQSLISTEHGNIVDIYLTRRYGTQGAYDFYIYYDPDRSTGVPGDFRTDVEHGFDVCRCDIDLGTLNPTVSSAGLGRWRIRFEHGEALKRIRAIIPYRTTVRPLNPVPLVDDYTYYVTERYTALAGHSTDNTPNEISIEGQRFSTITTDNLKSVWDIFSNKDVSNITDYLNNRVDQYRATYQVQTLPLPTSFVRPSVGLPESEDWKNQFNIFDRVLTYTVGRTFSCVVMYRMYATPGFTHVHNISNSPRTDYGSTDYAGSFTYTTYMVFDPDDPKNFTHQPNGFTYTDHGLGDSGFWLAGSDKSWLSKVDLLYTPNGEQQPHSGYESIRYVDHDEAQANPFNIDYSDYTNAPAGEFKTLPKLDHIRLDTTSYNVLFNDHGTDLTTLYNNSNMMAVSGIIPTGETYRETWADKRVHPGSSGYGVYAGGYPPSYNVIGPIRTRSGWSGMEYGKPYGPAAFRPNGSRDRYSPWEIKWDVSKYRWFGHYMGLTISDQPAKLSIDFQHDASVVGDVGLGEGGTSTTVYNVSSYITPLDQYEKNESLKGYYKCCNDHQDRQIMLVLDKVNANDPVGLDETVESLTMISKTPVYNVKQHSLYDNTVQEDHAMDPVPVMRAYQSWEDAPADPSVVEQLFVSDGADPASQVQFLSLSAGALEGGSSPTSNLPKPKPTTGPVLKVSPSTLVRDIVSRGVTKSWNRRFTNTGSGEVNIFLNNIGNGFVSNTNATYQEGLDTTTGSITADGDKLADWSWSIIGANGTTSYRQVGNETASFKLSADEYVDVQYVSANTSYNSYDISHSYEAHYPQPIGVRYDKILFEVSF